MGVCCLIRTDSATPEELATIWRHRLCGTSPGNPKWIERPYDDILTGLAVPRSHLIFRPGAKPVLPAGVKRIEDIEGFITE